MKKGTIKRSSKVEELDETITIRINHINTDAIKLILKKFPDDFYSISHFVTCAIKEKIKKEFTKRWSIED
jgi:hypothetical protein